MAQFVVGQQTCMCIIHDCCSEKNDMDAVYTVLYKKCKVRISAFNAIETIQIMVK